MARLVPLTLALLGFVALAPVSAQVDEGACDELIEEGLRLREAGQDDAALAIFERCVGMLPESGQAIGQVAFAEMALGRLVLAEAHLIAALEFGEDEWVVRHREALEQAQRTLNEQIATVEVLGEGEVSFDESGESVTRQTPVTLRLSPGRHELHVTSRGVNPRRWCLRFSPANGSPTCLRGVRGSARSPNRASSASKSLASRPRSPHVIRSAPFASM